MNPYSQNLDKCAANHQPLTPLTFLQRAAAVYPEQVAVVHGSLRHTYAEFYTRCRRLASALARRGIGKGDTVTHVNGEQVFSADEIEAAVKRVNRGTVRLTVKSQNRTAVVAVTVKPKG